LATDIPSFDEYVALLGAPTKHVDPTVESEEGLAISSAADSISKLGSVSVDELSKWIEGRPTSASVSALGLAVGLTNENMKNYFGHALPTGGFVTLAKKYPAELVKYLDDEFDLVRLLQAQLNRSYDFGDVLVARAGTRAFAVRAGQSGRKLEDQIEEVADSLGLESETRTRFEGRNSRTAPCDLAIPAGNSEAKIVVAAKYFGSTGSKQGDAVREVEEMADVRRPSQYVYAVIDGIGWKRRPKDLKRLLRMWETGVIDGMYTQSTLNDFQSELVQAAARVGLKTTP